MLTLIGVQIFHAKHNLAIDITDILGMLLATLEAKIRYVD